MTHQDLAALIAALYDTPHSVPWLYLSNPDANVVMGITRRDGYLIVTLRGSYDEQDWIHNVLVREFDPPGRPAIKRVHSGFYSGTPEAWDIVSLFYQPGDKVIFIGHSLGGARAEILAEHMTAAAAMPPVHLVVTWGQPAAFKPSTMPDPRYPFVAYRNVSGGADDVTWSTDLVGYRRRAPFVDLSAPPAWRNNLDPFNLHHFALYQPATPSTEVP